MTTVADRARIRSIAWRAAKSNQSPAAVTRGTADHEFMLQNSGSIWDLLFKIRAGDSVKESERQAPPPRLSRELERKPDDDDPDDVPDSDDDDSARCECACQSCESGNCEGCTADPCDDPNCDHGDRGPDDDDE